MVKGGAVKDGLGSIKTELKKDMIKRALLLLFAAASLVFGVTACHTAHGAGEDIQSTGETIQNHTPP